MLNPLLVSGLATGLTGLLGLGSSRRRRLPQQDLANAETARKLVGKELGLLGAIGPDSSYANRYQSFADETTNRGFNAAQNSRRENAARGGLAGSSGDIERDALLTRERAGSLNENYIRAQDAGLARGTTELNNRLGLVRTLQGLSTGIGDRQRAADEANASDRSGLLGTLGGVAAKTLAGGLAGEDLGIGALRGGLYGLVDPSLFSAGKGGGGDGGIDWGGLLELLKRRRLPAGAGGSGRGQFGAAPAPAPAQY